MTSLYLGNGLAVVPEMEKPSGFDNRIDRGMCKPYVDFQNHIDSLPRYEVRPSEGLKDGEMFDSEWGYEVRRDSLSIWCKCTPLGYLAELKNNRRKYIIPTVNDEFDPVVRPPFVKSTIKATLASHSTTPDKGEKGWTALFTDEQNYIDFLKWQKSKQETDKWGSSEQIKYFEKIAEGLQSLAGLFGRETGYGTDNYIARHFEEALKHLPNQPIK